MSIAVTAEREAKEELDRVVGLLRRFRDYAADRNAPFPVHSPGAHHNPLWAEVADTLTKHGL